MNLIDKSNIILKYFSFIRDSNNLFDGKKHIIKDEENLIKYSQQVLEEIVLNFSDNKYTKELLSRLKMDSLFQIIEEKYNPNLVEVIYNNDFIPYRLDLLEHSPMGFSIGYGTSSAKQLSLAILSIVVGDKNALKYYDEFTSYLLDTIHSTRKKQISYIDIFKWFIAQKRDKMKNMVKYVCSELNITQKTLAEEIGVSEGTVNRWSAKPDELPLQIQKTLNLLLENVQLKSNQEKLQKALALIEEVKNTQNISI